MSDIDDLIKQLTIAEKPKRDFDDRIAEFLGWRRAYVNEVDPATGETRKKQIPEWHPPGSSSTARVPYYTTNLDQAFHLARSVYPEGQIGFSWEQGNAHAAMPKVPIVRAHTPALALCAAALLGWRDKN